MKSNSPFSNGPIQDSRRSTWESKKMAGATHGFTPPRRWAARMILPFTSLPLLMGLTIALCAVAFIAATMSIGSHGNDSDSNALMRVGNTSDGQWKLTGARMVSIAPIGTTTHDASLPEPIVQDLRSMELQNR